ncbi:hypothetical protein LINPERPRIM_LOCUS38861 [Linum perenne]
MELTIQGDIGNKIDSLHNMSLATLDTSMTVVDYFLQTSWMNMADY